MAKYIGPKCRLSRREGVDLQHKSNIRALETKCKIAVSPGMHGQQHAKRMTDHGIQLREKQKVKRYYGVLERQFRRYYKTAARKKGATGYNLFKLLESRLDNIVYRLGFASTRAEARQIVNHRGVQVNTKVVNVPSYNVAPEDIVKIRDKSKKQLRIMNAQELAKQRPLADWLSVDADKMEGVFKRFPEFNEAPSEFNFEIVIVSFK
jgi:small subunit ribosomal protein S4